MGTDVYKIKSVGNFIKINNEIFNDLYEFNIDTNIVISMNIDDIKKLINKTKDKEKKEVYKKMLNEFEDEDCDFIIG